MKSNGERPAKAQPDHGTSTVRLTFRTFLPSLEKLYIIALKRGWVNPDKKEKPGKKGKPGKPNLSKAINMLIDEHDVGPVDSATQAKAHESAIEFLDKE